MIRYSNTYLELNHLVGEAHALLPNDVLHRHTDVLKRQNCRVRCLEEKWQRVLELSFPPAPTCIPSFEMADLVIPFESIGTTISDLFWWGLPSLVFANRQAQSACTVKLGRQGSSKMSSCLDLQPIGDPHLGAVDHQVAAIPPGRRGQRSHIAPSSRLTHL